MSTEHKTEHKTEHTTEHKTAPATPGKSSGFAGMNDRADKLSADAKSAPGKVEPMAAPPAKKS
jgi:hypothetical protein